MILELKEEKERSKGAKKGSVSKLKRTLSDMEKNLETEEFLQSDSQAVFFENSKDPTTPPSNSKIVLNLSPEGNERRKYIICQKPSQQLQDETNVNKLLTDQLHVRLLAVFTIISLPYFKASNDINHYIRRNVIFIIIG